MKSTVCPYCKHSCRNDAALRRHIAHKSSCLAADRRNFPDIQRQQQPRSLCVIQRVLNNGPNPNEDAVELTDTVNTENFPQQTALALRRKETGYQQLKTHQEKHQLNRYAPFANCEEWALANWIMRSYTGCTQIDKLLDLDIVSQMLFSESKS
jgi:hypothetical protein